jgi:aerobic-type carbon monoxide dehydrogenase small subunit (CoxS/CutS family)
MKLELTVNGAAHRIEVDPEMPLLWFCATCWTSRERADRKSVV